MAVYVSTMSRGGIYRADPVVNAEISQGTIVVDDDNTDAIKAVEEHVWFKDKSRLFKAGAVPKEKQAAVDRATGVRGRIVQTVSTNDIKPKPVTRSEKQSGE